MRHLRRRHPYRRNGLGQESKDLKGKNLLHLSLLLGSIGDTSNILHHHPPHEARGDQGEYNVYEIRTALDKDVPMTCISPGMS
ncbi:MAG: hypothetical protein A3F33_00345 [Candidatus Woykebacteria bacterium RIFCSPHIGHO2_12_FULL_43_10]|uniref:Uncharacterized protein n=1 Tax=Candidatus Woykebacteria bacterium RIFCSPHIGHO2_02_FULL_43_16b TaxID=1802601 RepID=A0A1G1WNV7_9BACT|nr:MAG: hypothetical protein A2802_02245 [Candidatus Woykebacteria bacterium RIFCSPHIGHO2_01_FULL_43_29]OGY28958.1 MAG: hypothetical protein A3F33_00345 [Candidatus Woykebacteria bacterium RIFCSPHIGHO2_12_FULL_43_10]OGY29432.1 MAG: hypothetical protein A3J50_00585 [Candidatus Woykebacteria bacterium RIFCSPHIGHO2_02_FULL_43_16b]